ncbi:L-threonylcarbamoyladenylate synthase [Cognatiyoonia sp. IB215446]|uniref:L-threonylcarbamoyladenylate synthase n=1 Tax=Cognatiyoonia sp. IB215446 TaxID=3097355 RepID=UPI002A15F5BB|nr:L-threonylcarbamoyladenylate synthase [Cognatiyoonia sp. IB215446]MDX8346711.1 L-threonylcarbamoyladenylate synthase [Cognatiyoonia sp. IB215446]
MSQATLRILSPDEAGLSEAVGILQQGGLVSFPTETVYGLGADARNDRAVAGIFAAKGRPSFNPLIVHVADLETAAKYVDFNDTAERLAANFWPGPLTLVLPLRTDEGISKLVTAGLDSLAVRVPDHSLAQGLLRRFAGPVAAPSANPSGRVSPTSAAHVIAGLGNEIDAVVDGGDCRVGLESTIVSCIGAPALLRAGGIPAERIEDCLGALLRLPDDPQTPMAPGQLASHYAPAGSVRLNANAAQDGEFLLGFGPVEADLNLSPSGDLTEAAARLFACLHALDKVGATAIAVSPIPHHGLGRAINDRLRRAAAPRG